MHLIGIISLLPFLPLACSLVACVVRCLRRVASPTWAPAAAPPPRPAANTRQVLRFHCFADGQGFLGVDDISIPNMQKEREREAKAKAATSAGSNPLADLDYKV